MTEPSTSDIGFGSPLGRPVEILLVEDSPSDVAMTTAALREARIVNRLSVVRDGEMALSFLRRDAPFADAPRPDLVLLDLNLPRMDGRDLLAALKTDPALATIPAVILSSSSADRDVLRSYELHANSYVRKPVGADDFFEAIRTIEDFWLSLVRLPPAVHS